MAMQEFSGFEYLLIDAANQFGLDKERFDSRLIWAWDAFDNLELLIPEAPKKTRPAFEKAVQVIRSVCNGNPTGHRMGMDAICSGMAIISALTGCIKGCEATGLISDVKSERPNAYTAVADAMARHLGGQQFVIDPDDVKKAVMTSLYGSKATPKRLFGNPDNPDEVTPELAAFYTAVSEVAPGASLFMDAALALWQPFALSHTWTLPDGHVSCVKVLETVEKRLRVDEMNGTSFTYRWTENIGQESGLSLVANITHSVDSYLLRTLIRHTNYDVKEFNLYRKLFSTDHVQQLPNDYQPTHKAINKTTQQMITLYARTGIADIRILESLSIPDISALSKQHINALLRIIERSLEHDPFEIIAVHDEFTSHVNNMNHTRNQYRHILADLAESNLLTSIFRQISGNSNGEYTKQEGWQSVSDLIRESNYALS